MRTSRGWPASTPKAVASPLTHTLGRNLLGGEECRLTCDAGMFPRVVKGDRDMLTAVVTSDHFLCTAGSF